MGRSGIRGRIPSGFLDSAPLSPGYPYPIPQPVFGRPMFGHSGRARAALSLSFVSRAAAERGIGQRLGLAKAMVPVEHCRTIGKKDLIHNQALPLVDVNPETYEVRADGRILTCEPAAMLPLAQRYFLF